MNELKPYKCRKKYEGYVEITLRVPIQYYVDGTMEVYSDNDDPTKEQYYEFDSETSVDDDLEKQVGGTIIKNDIKLFERLGYTVEEISVNQEREI